jgi:copper chaperone CopZ
MNNLYNCFVSLVLLFLAPNLVSAQFKSAKVQIDGLTCSMCSYSVQRSVQKLEFVKKVQVDLNTNLATIEFKDSKNVNIRDLIKAVKDAGFSVNSLTASFKVNGSNSENKPYILHEGCTYFILQEQRPLNGLIELEFIEKDFSDKENYKKYRSIIETKLSNIALRESYYFVVI